MSTQKECVDHLRAYCRLHTLKGIGAGHAHELVAAYFGYRSVAALRAEGSYQLNMLEEAEILIPDLTLMQQRIGRLRGLPVDLLPVGVLAEEISRFLVDSGYFAGDIWHTSNLAEYMETDVIQHYTTIIEDDLSGQMSETNAYFDQLDIEKVELAKGENALTVDVSGSLSGKHDWDRMFHGDSITFNAVMTFQRVAGRVAYMKPDIATGGTVNNGYQYDPAE
ncbi:hypothetical protein OQ252_12670 [Acetobacter farinalis]|uniref:Uncharacterized protein n=1 Tax=Acetobacter farinalis TaxID=1260984 RepID=A0ABT3QAC1_9PROT|nr:hypothetical protein [Acetobacter farinalis]MCX2562241.1 hypothetical protein [Acetobacter farinalis]NHO30858.1 hypothetical protein [Acetobacter farinalis]